MSVYKRGVVCWYEFSSKGAHPRVRAHGLEDDRRQAEQSVDVSWSLVSIVIQTRSGCRCSNSPPKSGYRV